MVWKTPKDFEFSRPNIDTPSQGGGKLSKLRVAGDGNVKRSYLATSLLAGLTVWNEWASPLTDQLTA